MEDELFCKSCSKEDRGNRINTSRFIDKLNNCFKDNDLNYALRVCEYWEQEALSLNDNYGLLTVLNEKNGLSRRLLNKDQAFETSRRILELLDITEQRSLVSGAIILTNTATTLSAFNEFDQSINLYNEAEEIYKNHQMLESYEYAAFLNNKAMTLSSLKQYQEAINLTNQAIELLKKVGMHDGEIAVSYINLINILYDQDQKKYLTQINEYLDTAWEYLNSHNQVRDAGYAYILTKCAPTYQLFNKELEAICLIDTAKEIYGMY